MAAEVGVITNCPFCNAREIVYVPSVGYHAWLTGELAQRAFPHLDPDDRERIITGTCPDCYKRWLSFVEGPGTE